MLFMLKNSFMKVIHAVCTVSVLCSRGLTRSGKKTTAVYVSDSSLFREQFQTGTFHTIFACPASRGIFRVFR